MNAVSENKLQGSVLHIQGRKRWWAGKSQEKKNFGAEVVAGGQVRERRGNLRPNSKVHGPNHLPHAQKAGWPSLGKSQPFKIEKISNFFKLNIELNTFNFKYFQIF